MFEERALRDKRGHECGAVGLFSMGARFEAREKVGRDTLFLCSVARAISFQMSL